MNKVHSEVLEAQRNARKHQKQVEPSEEEKKNGWTTETLTAYLADRAAGQSLAIDPNSLSRRKPPDMQNHKYRPLRWRG